MRFVMPFLVVFITLLFTHNSVNAQSSGALIEKAIELIDKNDFPTAEQILDMVIKKEPRNALGHYYMAEVIFSQKKEYETRLNSSWRSARANYYYRKAAKFDPNSKQGLDALAKAIRIEKGPWGREAVCYFEAMEWLDDCQKTAADDRDEVKYLVGCAIEFLPKKEACFKAR